MARSQERNKSSEPSLEDPRRNRMLKPIVGTASHACIWKLPFKVDTSVAMENTPERKTCNEAKACNDTIYLFFEIYTQCEFLSKIAFPFFR